MAGRLYEGSKVDVGLVPQALNNTNVTGAYHPFDRAREMLAVLIVGAMAATKTAILALYEAKDATGTDAQALTDKSVTITANTKVTKVTLTLASFAAGETVVIQRGSDTAVTFTAHASTTTAANREFSIGGDDTADAAALAGLINNATYGVDGVLASAATGVVTLTLTEPGRGTLTVTSTSTHITIATVEAMAYVALLDEELSDGYTHVAAKVTTTANTVVAVNLISTGLRYGSDQSVAAQTE